MENGLFIRFCCCVGILLLVGNFCEILENGLKFKRFLVVVIFGLFGILIFFLLGFVVIGGFVEVFDVGVFGLVGVVVLFLIGFFLVFFLGEVFLGVDLVIGFIFFLGVDFEGVFLLEDFFFGGLEVFFGFIFVFGVVCFGDLMGLILCLFIVLFRFDLERWIFFFFGLVVLVLLDILVLFIDFGGVLCLVEGFVLF